MVKKTQGKPERGKRARRKVVVNYYGQPLTWIQTLLLTSALPDPTERAEVLIDQLAFTSPKRFTYKRHSLLIQLVFALRGGGDRSYVERLLAEVDRHPLRLVHGLPGFVVDMLINYRSEPEGVLEYLEPTLGLRGHERWEFYDHQVLKMSALLDLGKDISEPAAALVGVERPPIRIHHISEMRMKAAIRLDRERIMVDPKYRPVLAHLLRDELRHVNAIENDRLLVEILRPRLERALANLPRAAF